MDQSIGGKTSSRHGAAAYSWSLMFDDVAIYFTQEEWWSLEEWQKDLYKEVMVDNYNMIQSLGIPMVKSEILLRIEGGEEPCLQGHPRWEELGCEEHTSPGGRSRTGAVVTACDLRWRGGQPLTYSRRVVRKRCGRRSPNFSRLELERFVSLMDRYLPDELQRAGAISLRQRRAILQEIARRLAPMSGCLRTPRQLLHRWADFNNRDPERLMQIRMQVHCAGSPHQSWELSNQQLAPSLAGRKRRTPHPPSSSSYSSGEEEEGEDHFCDMWGMGPQQSSPQASSPAHIDARGRYTVPPLLPKSEMWLEERDDLRGPPSSVKRSTDTATAATIYSSLHEQELRTIKSEPDSEEDEGGGGWRNDIPSPGSGSDGASAGWPSPALVSPEECYPMGEPPAGGRGGVKLEPGSRVHGPDGTSETWTEQEDSPVARSMRRSPNFSPAELECFVALMDHFLPNNLIRAGALPIRQRKAILQEIARRLQPLSGCLRTPRQLRHRWTDFNNRDPDRLEEIRRRLRRAPRQESSMKFSKESSPAAGNSWKHRSSPHQHNIKEKPTTPKQTRPAMAEEHTPRKPWHHMGLPKNRNSFSVARLKKRVSRRVTFYT